MYVPTNRRTLDPEPMNAEDPLFILYTSGSTGKPKGLKHTTGGYLVYASLTHQYVFDYKDGDIYWCTADVGWITGHSYIVYGPLANGATTLMFEGVPTYPDTSRVGRVIEKHKVNQFYTAPTAIRSLMVKGRVCLVTQIFITPSLGLCQNHSSGVWEWYRVFLGEGDVRSLTHGGRQRPVESLTVLLPGATAPKPACRLYHSLAYSQRWLIMTAIS